MRREKKVIRKEPWLSASLALACPGAGHIYAGKMLRGLVLNSSIVILASLGLWYIINSIHGFVTGMEILMLSAILFMFNIYDAHRYVMDGNNRRFEVLRKSNKDPWLAVFLSLIIPGLGHAYQKKWLFALGFFLVNLAAGLINNLAFYLILKLVITYICCYHVYIYAPVRREKNNHLIFNKSIAFMTISIILGWGLILTIMQFNYIGSNEMMPTLQPDDRIVVNKMDYLFNHPERGDIIVFEPTPKLRSMNLHDLLVKRIIGLPGEKVEIKNRQVYIDDQPLPEDYILEPPNYDYGPHIVPQDFYLVLGDSRNHSFDSHNWGFLAREYIIGKVTKIYLPWARNKILK